MGQSLLTVSSQRDPVLLVIKRCGGCSYFPAFHFSTPTSVLFSQGMV